MSTDTLSAVLQGLNNGAATGLDIYKTMKSEERAKRAENLKLRRYAIDDARYADETTYNRGQAALAQDNWQKNFDFEGQKHKDSVAYQQGQLAIAKQNANTAAGQLGLERNRFDDAVAERARVRAAENSRQLLSSALIDEQGQYITDDAQFADRANQNPQVIKATLDLAADRGLIDPKRVAGYTGAKLISTPQGLVMQVAGVDATGKPIKGGGGILSQNGTDSPDDPYVAINVSQLRQMVDPNFRAARQSQALADGQIAAYNDESLAQEKGQVESLRTTADALQSKLAPMESKLAELQAAREKTPTMKSQVTPRGDYREWKNPEAEALDKEIASLSTSLEGGKAELGQVNAALEQAPVYQQTLRQQYEQGIRGQQVLHGEKYQANTLAAAIEQPKQTAKVAAKADTNFGKVVETAIKDNAPRPRKGEEPPKVDASQLRTAIKSMPIELQRKIGTNPNYEAALHDVVRHMAQTGVVMEPSFLLEARAAGADLDAYTQYVSAPQNANKPKAQVHAEAVELAKQKAANPGADTGTLAGMMNYFNK